MDEVTVGARLRTLRRWRGMTQAEVAGLAGLSPSFLSMVEQGTRMLDRRSQIAGVASALRVSETDLVGGPHLSQDRLQSDPHMGIPPLRIALQTNTLTSSAVDRARPVSELHQIVFGQLEPMRRNCDYLGMGRVLPDVLDELHYHVAEPADEADQRLALEALVEACATAAVLAKGLGYVDLGQFAAQRSRDVASFLDDPVQKGKADFWWLLTLPHVGSWDRNLAAAERCANDLEPHARDALSKQVLGMITLTASMSAAAVQRGDRAVHWLDEASWLATQVPDDPALAWESFSAVNVGIWRVAIGVERGESGGGVLELAKEVNLDLFESKSARRAGLMLDVGRGLAREPRSRADAVGWLRRAEHAAPQLVRNNAAARETVAYLLNRANAAAGGRELRGMAARMGVPH
ncbi:MAG TPA: helix-turn-helix transcriptional regulator [Streptosporangiaceae bacterium]|nr:helix-turn-helix transcriptional regulator [Streptosporangiaceae bacterium]